MTNDTRKRLYRIGDYARYMGVSTDLLKHYEKCGLLKSVVAENGYRYYPFQESIALLECMRLQSYGLSLREVGETLHESSFEQVQQTLDEKTAEMEKRLRFQQMLIEEHRRISDWMNMMKDATIRTVIKDAEPVLFLPHSCKRDFIADKRISAILPAWIDAMPLVKSCCLSHGGPYAEDRYWGLVVSKSHADALNLPTNDAVQLIPGGRYLHVHIRHIQTLQESLPLQQVQEIFHAHGVSDESTVLYSALMRLGKSPTRSACGWFCAPLPD